VEDVVDLALIVLKQSTFHAAVLSELHRAVAALICWRLLCTALEAFDLRHFVEFHAFDFAPLGFGPFVQLVVAELARVEQQAAGSLHKAVTLVVAAFFC